METLNQSYKDTPLLLANKIKLELGQVVMTRGVDALLEERYGKSVREIALILVTRHRIGDWSEMCEEDALANLDDAYTGEGRILSAYHLPLLPGEAGEGIKIWVITEWDRSYTTILLPEEY